VLTTLVLVACRQPAEVVPGPQPAAFEMTVLAVGPCAEDSDATACVRVRVTNRGDAQGAGRCRLRGHTTTSTGEEQQVFGPRITLPVMPGHSSVEKVLVWTKKIPAEGFSGVCQPGLNL
jgi:hypothetical protein